MEKIVIKFLNRECYLEDYHGVLSVMSKDYCCYYAPSNLIHKLKEIFHITDIELKIIVQIWAAYIDNRNDLTKYWEDISGLVYIPFEISQATPQVNLIGDFTPRIALTTRYADGVVNPEYYALIDIANP